MADIKINVKTEGAEESLNTLGGIKKQIKDLKSQALSIGEGGKGFKELTSQANELQDKLDDLKDSSKSLQGTGIEKLKSSFGLLTDSFKNADFGKAQTAFKGLGAAMKAVPIFLIIEGIQYLVENFEKLSKGSGFLGKTLRAVGDIIQYVIDKIYEFTDAIGLTNSALDKQGEALVKNAEKGKQAIEDQTTAYDQQIAVAKASGKSAVNLEIEKQKFIIQTNKALIEQTIAYVKQGGILNEEQNKLLTEQLKAIKAANVQIQVIEAEEAKKKSDTVKKNNDKAKADKKKSDDDYANVLKTEQARLADIENAAIDKEEAKKKAAKEREKEAAKKAAEVAIQNRKDEALALEIIDKHSAESRLNTLKVNYEIELAAAGDNATKKLLIEAKYKEDKEKLEKEISESSNMQIQKIAGNVNKMAQEIGAVLNTVVGAFQAFNDLQNQRREQELKQETDKIDAQINALDAQKEYELSKEGLTNEQKDQINREYAQKEYELELLKYNRETAVKKKAFEQDKKLKIAQAVISTITGAIAAVTSALQSSIPYPGNIIAAVISGAAVAAMGVAQIAKIKEQQFDAGNPPSAPTLNASTPSSASNNVGGGAQQGPNLYSINGDTNTGQGGPNGQRQAQPIKAYVVSQEVTSSQNMNNVIERRASF